MMLHELLEDGIVRHRELSQACLKFSQDEPQNAEHWTKQSQEAKEAADLLELLYEGTANVPVGEA